MRGGSEGREGGRGGREGRGGKEGHGTTSSLSYNYINIHACTIHLQCTVHVCRFCSQREVEISRLENPVLSQFMPVIYHTIADTSKVYIHVHTPTACILHVQCTLILRIARMM